MIILTGLGDYVVVVVEEVAWSGMDGKDSRAVGKEFIFLGAPPRSRHGHIRYLRNEDSQSKGGGLVPFHAAQGRLQFHRVSTSVKTGLVCARR